MAVLISTSKNSYNCLFLLFNGTGEKCRTGSAWKRRAEGEGRARRGK
jgi:hypothetical protein